MAAAVALREPLAKYEEQRRPQHQPGQHTHERVSRRLEQQECPQDPAGESGQKQRQQYPARDIQPVAIGASAGGHAHPQGERVRGVGRNGRDADEQQRREGNKAPAPRHRVESAAQDAGEKKEDSMLQIQRREIQA